MYRYVPAPRAREGEIAATKSQEGGQFSKIARGWSSCRASLHAKFDHVDAGSQVGRRASVTPIAATSVATQLH
eukprot:5757912-Prymnesium_polylepis.1